jgi:predicted alpha/beta-hydrolase family hydrolase
MRCTLHVTAGVLEIKVALSRGGAVSAGVALAAGHRAGRSPIVVLAPGAGSDRHHPSLAGIQTGLAAAGWTTITFDFPYREAGRRIPDPRPVLERCWGAVLDAVHGDARLAPPWVAIGGRSMGGRIASHVAAAGVPVKGLVFLGFPLHPAGRPGVERAAHLPAIAAPMLFVQGTRDALAQPALMARVLAELPRATLHAVDGADHGFHVPRRSGRDDEGVRAEIVAAVAGWLRGLEAG